METLEQPGKLIYELNPESWEGTLAGLRHQKSGLVPTTPQRTHSLPLADHEHQGTHSEHEGGAFAVDERQDPNPALSAESGNHQDISRR